MRRYEVVLSDDSGAPDIKTQLLAESASRALSEVLRRLPALDPRALSVRVTHQKEVADVDR